jgi:hypothetical protein
MFIFIVENTLENDPEPLYTNAAAIWAFNIDTYFFSDIPTCPGRNIGNIV